MNRKRLLTIVGIVALLVIFYLGYEHVMYVKTDNAQIEAHTVMLAPKIQGFVMKVNVVEGQKVKAGDVLIELDDRDYQNSLKQVQAQLASMEARRRDAERNFNRLNDLYKKEVVSQQQYDQASATYKEVRANYEAIEAQVAQGQLNIENAKIVAPTDGFIARKSVEVAQLAAPGVPLVGFVDAHERWVIANFKETDMENIRVGAKVDIDVDAIGSRDFKGTVVSVSAATGATFTLLPPDNATGNFTKVVQRVPVRIKLENLTEKDIESLRAGLSANVAVHKH